MSREYTLGAVTEAEKAKARVAELRSLLQEALASEKSAVRCGEVGAFDDAFRAKARAALLKDEP